MRVVLLAGLLFGCDGIIGDGGLAGGGGGGTAMGGGAATGGGDAMLADPVYLPPGIRRLSAKEAEAAVTSLLGVSGAPFAVALGSDVRQLGYTRNADQRVGSVQAEALWTAAETLAHQAVTSRLTQLAPCSSSQGSATCGQTFIRSFAPKAFRRQTTAAEETALSTVYAAGQASGGGHAGGVELVISAVLQSGSFLYLTELGTDVATGPRRLTGEEIATHLAFLFTGQPPSEALLASGRSGALDTPAQREAAAQTLAETTQARTQIERLLLEWVSADAVDGAAKDAVMAPSWNDVRADVLAEARSLIDAAVFDGDDRLQTVLTGRSVVRSARLATFYAEPGSGMMQVPATRPGLLLTGAFTAANAHPDATSPVKRGALVRKRFFCQDLPLPSGLGDIKVPAPDPSLTARERYAAHSQSEACASCHKLLDPIGFALENFDAAGRWRVTENGKPIDPSGSLVGAGDADGPFANGVELVQRLAPSTTVSHCFARQVFRFASGRAGADEELTFANRVPEARRGQVKALLVEYAKSDSFVLRRQP